MFGVINILSGVECCTPRESSVDFEEVYNITELETVKLGVHINYIHYHGLASIWNRY